MRDADVEVAEGSETSDPVIGVAQVGGMIYVRTVAGEKGMPLSLEVDIDVEGMDGKIREQETRDAMSLQMPVKRVARTHCGSPPRLPASPGPSASSRRGRGTTPPTTSPRDTASKTSWTSTSTRRRPPTPRPSRSA